jgi:hypothetical protein
MSRHAPPGYAGRGNRKDVYSSAMEQAEQFLFASETIGYAIKPILLYYGLNQALRAVAAVCYKPKDSWTFSSHGLSCRNLDQIKDLRDVQVEETGRGAFQVLAELFGSPALTAKVRLGDLWASLPEGTRAPLRESDDLWIAAGLSAREDEDVATRDGRSGWSGSLSGLPISTIGMGYQDVEKLVHEKYPLTRIALMQVRDDGGEVADGDPFTIGPSRPSISLESPQERRLAELMIDHGTAMGYQPLQYRNERWIIPCLPGNSRPLHSFSTWWAILYALSAVARYAPAKWTSMLDINSSPDAANIEYVLDKAHQRCINLVRSQLVFRGSMIANELHLRKNQ